MADVTVVIPFWNLDPSVLEQCVGSVRTQTEPCEILVVDNFSDVPVQESPGVRVLRLEERVSVGKARNLGLRAVTTPYLMFLDADDVLLPGAVGTLLGLLQTTSGASMAAGRIIDWIPETGFRRQKPWPSNFAHRLTRFPRVYRVANLIRNMTPVTGCAVMRTDVVRKTAGFPDSTAEDWTFGMLMSFHGRVVLSTKDVKLYRWRQDGLSKQAVFDLPALYEARKATRRSAMASMVVPNWIKVLSPVLHVLHVLELPFHVRRERAFSNMDQISANPVTVPIDATKVFEARRRTAATAPTFELPARKFTFPYTNSSLLPSTGTAFDTPTK